uniref:Uncharacterized protein n=1 Tax=Bartonella schoenbuchensis (strain DSM 13525 / NCTC 13165 / R1) TaxID=687861 RepID=E6Z1G2_BARSR|nr:conserved hypothetical protein [Bartonella schoenbuchensis R1]
MHTHTSRTQPTPHRTSASSQTHPNPPPLDYPDHLSPLTLIPQ